MKIKKTEEGICPVCGSDNIEWGETEFEMPLMFYKCWCRECKAEFVEVYKVEYDGFNMDDENGVEHLYDANGNELK
jgi:hypothetical protein